MESSVAIGCANTSNASVWLFLAIQRCGSSGIRLVQRTRKSGADRPSTAFRARGISLIVALRPTQLLPLLYYKSDRERDSKADAIPTLFSDRQARRVQLMAGASSSDVGRCKPFLYTARREACMCYHNGGAITYGLVLTIYIVAILRGGIPPTVAPTLQPYRANMSSSPFQTSCLVI